MTTSIVYNNDHKQQGLQPFYYRARGSYPINTPAEQYQTLKRIQNTVRVYSSLYASNLGPLTAYKQPVYRGVCWNQMSDRPIPSVQTSTVPTGTNSSMNRKHSSVTSSRPGCQAPGGIGCDIKHNSYDRYLNRLKGKGPLRRGIIPPGFGAPIPFNRAFPIYGGKTVKTNIVNGCDCREQNIQIYNNPNWQANPEISYRFNVGDFVYVDNNKATILSMMDHTFYIQFADGNIREVSVNEMRPYFSCECDPNVPGENVSIIQLNNVTNQYGIKCTIPVNLFTGNAI
jgi:hypothetical protein